MVKELLEREDVTTDTVDKDGRTPPSWSEEFGNRDVVWMIVERIDANASMADRDGRTPVLSPAERRNIIVTEVLLERCSHT